jgi:hypothetical protein
MVALSVLLPIAAYAVEPLVPCGGKDQPMCHFSDLLLLADKIINFLLLDLLVPIAILAFIYGGFLMITAQGDPGQLKQGKDIFFNTVIGFVIAFGAWIIVHLILTTLVDSEFIGKFDKYLAK